MEVLGFHSLAPNSYWRGVTSQHYRLSAHLGKIVPLAKNVPPKKKKLFVGWFLYGELIRPKSTNLFKSRFPIRKAIPIYFRTSNVSVCSLIVHLKYT